SAGMTPDVPSTALCFLSHESRTVEALQRLGARVLLSGVGGDQMFWSQPDPALLVADRVAQWRTTQAARDAVGWARLMRVPALRSFSRAVRYTLPRPLQPRVGVCEPWIERGFARRTHIADRLLRSRSDIARGLPTHAAQLSDIKDVMRVSALEC